MWDVGPSATKSKRASDVRFWPNEFQSDVKVALTLGVGVLIGKRKRPYSTNGRSEGHAHCMQYITITKEQKNKQKGHL